MPNDAPLVVAALPALRGALADHGTAVLQAPPGSGKTTRVPLALLDEPWLASRRIIMLEPRRLAARAAATWMAHLLGQPVGATVGYRMRRDTRVGPAGRVEVVTEGVLTRMLSADPGLDGVGLVIFDEFHERSLQADLGLALTLHERALLRDDLRVLVMSATLDGQRFSELLGGAPLVTAEGRPYPVETRYLRPRADAPIPAIVAAAVRDALDAEAGDVLVFLPGAAEIRRTADLLAAGLDRGVRVHPLYGDLEAEAQQAAIAPSPPGGRKVVLATSIAETSLTIEGVRVVIDAGLARVPRFSPRTGMTRLETVRVSRAAADQRRGRAGRTGPGTCWRLWPEAAMAELRPYDTPEILDADLAPLALELADAGVGDVAELAWLDPPPAAALEQARDLLAELGALEPNGRLTPHGRSMASLPMHPRLAHMLLRAPALGLQGLACDLAALLSERDPFRGGPGTSADVSLRLDALHRPGASASPAILRRIRAEARSIRQRLRVTEGTAAAASPSEAGLLLALAYPDRIGQRRPGVSRFLLRNGMGAFVDEADPLSREDYIVAAELDGKPRESRIYLGAPLALVDLEREFGGQLSIEEKVAWDDAADAVVARRSERLGAIVLRESPIRDPDPEAVAAALLDRVRRAGVGELPWTDGAQRIRERIRFLHRLDRGWPDVSDTALLDSLSDWLGPAVRGIRRWDELGRVDLAQLMLARLPWERRAALDTLAPTHIQVPSGSRIAIDYANPEAPVLAVRLQEVFGWTETPRVGGGVVPLTLHLLSPARRPVQVTRDLASFWRTTYFEVRKDLKGRYPKHRWPDDPLQASASRRPR